MLNRIEQRILSAPIELHWAGWRSDTHQLQQAGWQLSAEQDPFADTLAIAARHPQLGARGLTRVTQHRFHQLQPGDWGNRIRTSMSMQLAGQVMVHHEQPCSFAAIDAMPQLARAEYSSLDDLAHFAPQLTRTEQILVPEESVDDLLARILEKQQASKTAYFRDVVAREGEILPAHRFAAQIIAFPRAA